MVVCGSIVASITVHFFFRVIAQVRIDAELGTRIVLS